MAPPAIRRYSHGDRVYVRAQQVWMILVGHVMNTSGKFTDRLLTYGDLAKKMGISPKAAIGLGREVGIVGEYCLLNGLPALNCIVVGQQTGAPGHGVLVGKNKSWRDEARDSFATDWFRYRVPSTGTLRQVWEQLGEEAA
ncbi:hypothetical protein ACVI1J_005152 [Bradyrhizobium diazoefficiens]